MSESPPGYSQNEQPNAAATPMTAFAQKYPDAQDADYFLFFAETVYGKFANDPQYAAAVIEAWVTLRKLS